MHIYILKKVLVIFLQYLPNMSRVVETEVLKVNGTKQLYSPLLSGAGSIRVNVEIVKLESTVIVA